MTIDASVREQIRQRANFACEFCGVSETDVGGQLTIDHFQPTSKGGGDNSDNLIYSCPRCNQYKLDYWPSAPGDLPLWSPRLELVAKHLLELDDGKMHPLTATGAHTIHRLRLNRPPLVAHRRRKRQEAEQLRLLTRYQELVRLIEPLLFEQAVLLEEQRNLLQEQRELLQLLLRTKSE